VNRSTEFVAALSREIEATPTAELGSIVGALEGLKMQAYLRVVSAAVASRPNAASDEQDDLLTTREAAERLHMSQRFVRKHANDFGGVRLGRAVRFSRRSLDSFIRRKHAG
jgi:excisionase family DNA binding protein